MRIFPHHVYCLYVSSSTDWCLTTAPAILVYTMTCVGSVLHEVTSDDLNGRHGKAERERLYSDTECFAGVREEVDPLLSACSPVSLAHHAAACWPAWPPQSLSRFDGWHVCLRSTVNSTFMYKSAGLLPIHFIHHSSIHPSTILISLWPRRGACSTGCG